MTDEEIKSKLETYANKVFGKISGKIIWDYELVDFNFPATSTEEAHTIVMSLDEVLEAV